MLKTRNKLLLIGVLLLALLGVVIWRFRAWDAPLNTSLVLAEEREFATLQLGQKPFAVVVSRTPEQIQQGLSDRENIGADGMLFIMPEKRAVTFWMYHMRFALDFVWIADGQVVGLHENVPAVPPLTPEQEIPVVAPAVAVDMVLEVPGGFIQRNGITEGMSVIITDTKEVRPWR